MEEPTLRTIQDLKEWLLKEENTFKSGLYIIQWRGCWPSISRQRLELLEDRGFLVTVLVEHLSRRNKPPEEGDAIP